MASPRDLEEAILKARIALEAIIDDDDTPHQVVLSLEAVVADMAQATAAARKACARQLTDRELQILVLARDGKCKIKNNRQWKAVVSDGLHAEGMLERTLCARGYFYYRLTAKGLAALPAAPLKRNSGGD